MSKLYCTTACQRLFMALQRFPGLVKHTRVAAANKRATAETTFHIAWLYDSGGFALCFGHAHDYSSTYWSPGHWGNDPLKIGRERRPSHLAGISSKCLKRCFSASATLRCVDSQNFPASLLKLGKRTDSGTTEVRPPLEDIKNQVGDRVLLEKLLPYDCWELTPSWCYTIKQIVKSVKKCQLENWNTKDSIVPGSWSTFSP